MSLRNLQMTKTEKWAEDIIGGLDWDFIAQDMKHQEEWRNSDEGKELSAVYWDIAHGAIDSESGRLKMLEIRRKHGTL